MLNIKLLKKMLPFYFICFSLFQNLDGISENNELRKLNKTLQEIPKEDLIQIKSLFEHIFKYNELGFTLFGDKPISFCSIDKGLLSYEQRGGIYFPKYCENIFELHKTYEVNWLVWEKHRSKFDIKNFVFVDNKIGILLINKVNFLKTVRSNLDLVSRILGDNLDAITLLKRIENGEYLFKTLNKNHELLGVFLGFGRENSRLFQRREELDPQGFSPFLQKHISPSKGYESVEDELADLWRRLSVINNHDRYFPIVNLVRVGFAADPNFPETEILRSKYELDRKRINKIMANENWFEEILLQLTRDN